jgi:hypothetical protein
MRIEDWSAAGHSVGEGAGWDAREIGMSIESLKTDSVRPASLLARADGRGVNLVFLGALAASFFVAYLPTYLRLAGGRVANRAGGAWSPHYAGRRMVGQATARPA